MLLVRRINGGGYLIVPSEVREIYGSPLRYPQPEVSVRFLDEGDVVSVCYTFEGLGAVRDEYEVSRRSQVGRKRGKYHKR